MFDLTESLIQRYPCMSPFDVRREKFGEVAKLVRRINEREYTARGGRKQDRVEIDDAGNTHIWREAGDDFW